MLDECQMIPTAHNSTKVELYRSLHRGRNFIHSNLCDEISIASIEKSACLSPFHFHRSFKSLFWLSVHEYVRNLRMERSLTMLKAGAETIDCVAHSVGYAYHSSFTRAFKRHFGHAPAQLV